MRFVNESEGKTTRYFVFPEDEPIVERIIQIARSQKIWTPEMDDFEEERVRKEETGDIIKIYRHCSFWTDDYSDANNGNSICMIPNVEYKKSVMNNQYINYMRGNGMWDPIDAQEYIARLAENDRSFFAWLFDDPSLHGIESWQLNDEQSSSWREFWDSFDCYI